MSDPTHGLYSTYSNHRCRCDPCRAAWNKHNLRRRIERASQDVAAVHGKPSTYTNWGCRCTDCRAAHAAYERGRRARQLAAS